MDITGLERASSRSLALGALDEIMRRNKKFCLLLKRAIILCSQAGGNGVDALERDHPALLQRQVEALAALRLHDHQGGVRPAGGFQTKQEAFSGKRTTPLPLKHLLWRKQQIPLTNGESPAPGARDHGRRSDALAQLILQLRYQSGVTQPCRLLRR